MWFKLYGQQIEEEPDMGVMVKCLHTFNHTVYIRTDYKFGMYRTD